MKTLLIAVAITIGMVLVALFVVHPILFKYRFKKDEKSVMVSFMTSIAIVAGTFLVLGLIYNEFFRTW